MKPQLLNDYLKQCVRERAHLKLGYAAAWALGEGAYREEYLYHGSQAGIDGYVYVFLLEVAHRLDPLTYHDMVEGLAQGWGGDQLRAAFNRMLAAVAPGVPAVGWLDDLAYGVPCDFAGIDISDPTIFDEVPDIAWLLTEVLGVAIGSDDPLQACQEASPTMMKIAQSLLRTGQQPHVDIGLTLLWMWQATGSTLLDYDVDEFWDCGFEPPAWEPDMIQRVSEAHHQARLVIEAAQSAVEALKQNAALREAIKRKLAGEAVTWPSGTTPELPEDFYYLSGEGARLKMAIELWKEDDEEAANRELEGDTAA